MEHHGRHTIVEQRSTKVRRDVQPRTNNVVVVQGKRGASPTWAP